MIKKTICTGSITLPKEACERMESREEFEAVSKSEFVKKQTALVRSFKKLGFTTKADWEKRKIPLIIPTYSRDDVKGWALSDYVYDGTLEYDVDQFLTANDTPEKVFHEMQRVLKAEGKDWEEFIILTAQSVSGGGKTKVLMKIPYAESTLDQQKDFDTFKHLLGCYEGNLDLNCRPHANRPMYIPQYEDVVYFNPDPLFTLEDDWAKHVDEQLKLKAQQPSAGRSNGAHTTNGQPTGSCPPTANPGQPLQPALDATESFFHDFQSGRQVLEQLLSPTPCGRETLFYNTCKRLRHFYRDHGPDVMAKSLMGYTRLSEARVLSAVKSAWRWPWPDQPDLHIRKLMQRFGIVS